MTSPGVSQDYPKGGWSKSSSHHGKGIFVDPETEEGLEIWVDVDIRGRFGLVKRLIAEGAQISNSHSSPTTSLLILSPRSTKIFDMYCYPDWLLPRQRRRYDRALQKNEEVPDRWTKKVLLKSYWADMCFKMGHFLGEGSNWGGCRAGGPPQELIASVTKPVEEIPMEPEPEIPVVEIEPPTSPLASLSPPTVLSPLKHVESAFHEQPVSRPMIEDPAQIIPTEAEPMSESEEEEELEPAQLNLPEQKSNATSPDPLSMEYDGVREGAPVDREHPFLGLRFSVDLDKPGRMDWIRKIKAAGGTISATYEGSTHVLVHHYTPHQWDDVMEENVPLGIWFLTFDWAQQCIDRGEKIQELGFHVPGGAPLELDQSSSQRAPTRSDWDQKNTFEAYLPTANIASIFQEHGAMAYRKSKRALGQFLAKQYQTYSVNHWVRLFNDWEVKTGRFGGLSKIEPQKEKSSNVVPELAKETSPVESGRAAGASQRMSREQLEGIMRKHAMGREPPSQVGSFLFNTYGTYAIGTWGVYVTDFRNRSGKFQYLASQTPLERPHKRASPSTPSQPTIPAKHPRANEWTEAELRTMAQYIVDLLPEKPGHSVSFWDELVRLQNRKRSKHGYATRYHLQRAKIDRFVTELMGAGVVEQRTENSDQESVVPLPKSDPEDTDYVEVISVTSDSSDSDSVMSD